MFYQWYQGFSKKILADLPANRLLSLDVFRGITITAMVLVNNPGSWSYVYPPMAHAQWHGWTPTDLIFPFFVFIIGVSIAIVTDRPSFQQANKLEVMKTACIRGAKLFGLGLFLALFYYNFSNPNYSWWEEQLGGIRIMGVLQRLSIIFVFTMFIVVFCKFAARVTIAIALLVAYWAALSFVPYFDGDTKYVGLLEHGNNLTAWLDHTVFAAKHLYYEKALPFAFDPEGLLSTLPAISGALAGVFTGQLLLSPRFNVNQKIKYLGAAGLLLVIAGELWGLSFPINKSIWTSSFVLLSTGWALIGLAALTYLVDVKRCQAWTAPFVIFGANAIAFFMFSAMLARVFIMIPLGETSLKGWLYSAIYQPLFGNYLGSLMFAVSFCIVCFFVMHYLYKKRIFFKV